MRNYRDYQRYRQASRGPGLRFWRAILWIGIIILVVVIGRGLIFGKGGSSVSRSNTNNIAASDTGTNSASNENANANAATDANSNSSTNSSVSSAGSFITTKDCPKPISQYGTDKKMALTFDGGAATGSVNDTLKILEDTKTPATFFLTGAWARNNPEVVKTIAGKGYGVHNHSDSHPHFPALTDEQMAKELADAEASISALTGKTTKPLFRPPYGDYTDATTAAVRTAGYCSILWTVDALDWQEGQTAEAAKQRVLDKARAGGIVLMHIGDDLVPKFLGDTIAGLRGQGYQLVSLEDLLHVSS